MNTDSSTYAISPDQVEIFLEITDAVEKELDGVPLSQVEAAGFLAGITRVIANSRGWDSAALAQMSLEAVFDLIVTEARANRAIELDPQILENLP